MIKAILGKKLGMSQKITQDGRQIPITKIQAGPCIVVDIKTPDRDGYQALVLGFGEKKKKNIKKPIFLREVDLNGETEIKVGDIVGIGDILKVGDTVAITGISKGKGFAGVVKRWSFAGGPATHGQSDRERAPGSIGSTTTPGRVLKGKRMAGRMGGKRVTIKNLEVIGLDPENNLLEIKGAVPGVKEGWLMIKKGGPNGKTNATN
jgi:large subunit ribosomal protein L3